MQFLEKGLSGLETAVHKVDALAAKVAVERGVAREAEPDELATDPSAFDTADAIRALATRLGEWTAPSGAPEDPRASSETQTRDGPGQPPVCQSQTVRPV